MSRHGDGPDEGFLTRWSRRKREPEPEAGATPVLAPVPPAELPAQVEAGATSPAEPEMVEPPSLDLIDKDFDVAHWLKQNVPESWKLAALRRAWESDPAIRDFENPARDYALDWNTPGGAPGYGPLTESDDVEAMARAIFGETPESSAQTAGNAGEAGASGEVPHQLSLNADGPADDIAKQHGADPLMAASFVRQSEKPETTPESAPNLPIQPGVAFAAAQNEPASEDRTVRIRKRGGGAMPN